MIEIKNKDASNIAIEKGSLKKTKRKGQLKKIRYNIRIIIIFHGIITTILIFSY